MKNIFKKLINDEYRYYLQMIVVPLFLGITAFIMSIINFFSHKEILMYVTIFFSVVSLGCALITYVLKKTTVTVYFLFESSIILLFTYFLITGGTGGFSPVWIYMLPALGLFLFGRRRGRNLCICMLIVLVVLFWTPWGKSLLRYEYTGEYLMRFPIVYCFYYGIGFLFEKIRVITYNELKDLREEYERLSTFDALTNLHNRFWFNEKIKNMLNQGETIKNCGFILVDIDDFKLLNDNYGHLYGDEVLAKVAGALEENLSDKDFICRWGGEEFLTFVASCDKDDLQTEAEKMRQIIESMIFDKEKKVTISLGVTHINELTEEALVKVFAQVDEAMYEAKMSGKNRVRSIDL